MGRAFQEAFPMTASTPLRLLVGVGNAGITVLDRIAVKHPGMKGLLVVNNDPESLAASIITDRIAVPEGDPGDGFLAIEEEFGRIASGAAAVLLCGGLGSGTTSFLLPALAVRAKAAGITTIACVGTPFNFEGRGKREVADAALKKLHALCDAVAVIDNDRLSGGAPSTAAVGEAFQVADLTLLSSLLSLRGMISTTGPVKITRSDLAGVLGVPGALTHFGSGSAEGANRLHEALERALKSPLLTLPGKGSALREVSTVLLLLRGPQDLSFAEVQMAVAEIERIAGEKCLIKVGVHADGPPGSPLELSITASSGGRLGGAKHTETRTVSSPSPTPTSGVAEARGAPPAAKAVKPVKSPASKQTQGVLDLDTYQRGRFDKSEPTIVEGEDLDVPAFLRKGVKLNPPPRE
jgi:cell division protein FtsZ